MFENHHLTHTRKSHQNDFNVEFICVSFSPSGQIESCETIHEQAQGELRQLNTFSCLEIITRLLARWVSRCPVDIHFYKKIGLFPHVAYL